MLPSQRNFKHKNFEIIIDNSSQGFLTMVQGLLTVRAYLDKSLAEEELIIEKITQIWEEVEWSWFTKGGQDGTLIRYLAIDQGPIIIMIENHRTNLLWDLFMSDKDLKTGLNNLNFTY